MSSMSFSSSSRALGQGAKWKNRKIKVTHSMKLQNAQKTVPSLLSCEFILFNPATRVSHAPSVVCFPAKCRGQTTRRAFPLDHTLSGKVCRYFTATTWSAPQQYYELFVIFSGPIPVVTSD
eukprot:1176351-Prorocentrum_minimum.AAC.7